jgi:ABC-type transporter Mla subunit MlaD
MKRLLIIGALVAIVPWIVIGIVREAGDDDTQDGYYVRSIFDNASAIVKGEDVKVAGATVGVVQDLEVTDDNKAAITLRIDDDAFVPFKRDAKCTIRPQSLIGEKFVECEPGTASAAALQKIDEGDGKGERLLPLERTSAPVDLDLINNVMRLPYRQRFAILLNELGTGLAGRGEDLNAVIHRANPALRETDRLLKTLAGQNKVLARLAVDSDRALAPLARERKRVSSWIVQANATGEASAERRDDIRAGINRLPEFLRQLRPLMADLEDLTDEGTPVLSDLGDAAPALGRLIRGQGTLSTASRESFPSLGDALERGRPALLRSRPLIRDLGRFGRDARPVSEDLDELTASLDKSGGVERIMDFVYYLGLATNGFDSIGHYLRAGLLANSCSDYSLEPIPVEECNARFAEDAEAAGAPGGAAKARSATMKRTAPAKGGSVGTVPPTAGVLQGLLGPGETPAEKRTREGNLERLRRQAERPSPGLPGEPALDYLLGDER